VTGRGDGLLILTPLRLEARALRRRVPGARVARTGFGPERARRAAVTASRIPAQAMIVAGFGGGLAEGLQPGDLVVASEVAASGRTVAIDGSAKLAGMLRAAGLSARHGPLASASGLVWGRARARLAATGALAVDMESAWLLEAAAGRPVAVIRAIVDAPGRDLVRPLATAAGALRAYRSLARAAPVLGAWAQSLGGPDTTASAGRLQYAGGPDPESPWPSP